MIFARFGPVLFFMVAIAALGLVLYEWSRAHPQDMPWTPLSLADPVGRFTTLKLARIRDDPDACRALLDAASEAYRSAPAVSGSGGCGYADGVRLRQSSDFSYAPDVTTSCTVAASLFLWEKQIVQPAAMRHFGKSVRSIRNYGSFSCRPIRGRTSGLSEHATANAIDIAEFRLADGHRISVVRDWQKGADDKDAAFLREVRDGACRIFATTLSPDYNAAHRDHLHLDQAARGGWRFCR